MPEMSVNRAPSCSGCSLCVRATISTQKGTALCCETGHTLPGSDALGMEMGLHGVITLLKLVDLSHVVRAHPVVGCRVLGRRVVGEGVDVVRSGGVWRGRHGLTQARATVLDQHRDRHASGGHGAELQVLVLSLTLALVATVLEPDLHLRNEKRKMMTMIMMIMMTFRSTDRQIGK